MRIAPGASWQTQYAATARSSVASSPSDGRQAAFCAARSTVRDAMADVGDLHRDGLELRECAAELGAALMYVAVRSRARRPVPPP